jgi:hypothetical protein
MALASLAEMAGFDYTSRVCNGSSMVRAQIVLDEATAQKLHVVSERSRKSMSEIVRQALVFYFQHREPDTSWFGSLRPAKGKRISHDWEDIRKSVAAGHKREGKRYR